MKGEIPKSHVPQNQTEQCLMGEGIYANKVLSHPSNLQVQIC